MYLVIDCETGGIGTQYSLLTLYICVVDSSFKLLQEFDFKLKPDDGNYVVCGTAMEINKIDLAKHDKEAITYKEVSRILGNYLYTKYTSVDADKRDKFIVIGHNVKGDIQQITDKLIKEDNWLQWVSYRTLDTGPIGQFLKLCGKLPQELSGSLVSYAKHFNIEHNAHDAKSDALVTLEVLKNFIKLI